jgi:lactate dehydrogenase-like 2-hydroxyacid dehydrogenase
MVGTQVTGKRLGILGMGRVGRVVARRARGFDMQIHYHDIRPVAGSDEGVYHGSLDEMLPHCDFLSLHCNVTPLTRGLIDAKRLALLPDGAILVNAARGALVNDDALVDALKSGKLRAAGIDAYNNEPNVDPRLTALPNTFLMPHIGSATRETRDAMGFRALDNLDAFFAGREPRDRVA